MFQLDLMNHVKRVRRAMEELGGKAHIDTSDLSLDATIADRTLHFYPQFTRIKDNRRQYTYEFTDDIQVFNGWYPVLNKWWEFSSEKLKFKELLMERGLRTPAYFLDKNARPADVIIKHTTSSFGDGLRGPFKTVGEHAPETLLKDGEYYEQFIFGSIVKIWYWNETPICLKLRDMPVLKGDGSSTVQQLLDNERAIIAKYHSDDWFDLQDWNVLYGLLDYQGTNANAILPHGRQVLIDYRYNHCWVRMTWVPDNALPTCGIQGLREQLNEAGRTLWNEIPDPMRQDTVYTVDAILDSRDSLWFLEMNSNPQVHPDIYLPMFRDLFSRPTAPSPIVDAPPKPMPALLPQMNWVPNGDSIYQQVKGIA